MPHPELAVGAFLSALLVLLPLPWHWRARNATTLSIIAWLFISNVIYGVNAAVWAGNVERVGTIWCDIVTKLQIGGTIALPACCLALCINLESVASLRNAHTTAQSKRRKLFLDIGFCWLLPIAYMGLHYIVQGHRFDIVEDFGCRPTTYNSVASVFVIWLPPMLCALATLILACICLYHFFRRRISFARHLQNNNSGLTTSRYFRLIAMSIVQMFWGIVIMALNMSFTLRTGLRPWVSWEDVHSDWLRVDVFPARFIPKPILTTTHVIWWTIPVSAWLFFVFFSFGDDAMNEYRKCVVWVRKTIFHVQKAESVRDRDMMKGLRRPSFVKPLRYVIAPAASSKSFPTVSVVSSTLKSTILPTSSPIHQETTSLDDTLFPQVSLYKTAGTEMTFGSLSSTARTDTTLHDPEGGHARSGSCDDKKFSHAYKLRDSTLQYTDCYTVSPIYHSFRSQEPRAIGSYSDLSVYPPSAPVVSPCSTAVDQSDSPVREGQEEEFSTPRSSFTDAVALPHREEADLRQEERRASSPPIAIPDPTHEFVLAPTGSRRRPLLLFEIWQDSRRPITYPSYEAEIRGMEGTLEGPP